MKIEIDKKNINPEGEPMDLIEFNSGAVGIVAEEETVFLIKDSCGTDWGKLSINTYNDELKKGKYKILAKADEWKIVKDEKNET